MKNIIFIKYFLIHSIIGAFFLIPSLSLEAQPFVSKKGGWKDRFLFGILSMNANNKTHQIAIYRKNWNDAGSNPSEITIFDSTGKKIISITDKYKDRNPKKLSANQSPARPTPMYKIVLEWSYIKDPIEIPFTSDSLKLSEAKHDKNFILKKIESTQINNFSKL